mmetsp:Transcript_26126/g.41026  ORF Transcript_26126/g.41026 Transcript_26126/m.41026 type:complete len:478 (-) Transcript_26126:1-1434(-)
MPTTEDIPRKHMIALYYCYPPAPGIPKDNLEAHKLFHQEICTNLDLGGRIRVSEEGINGVLSGTEDALRDYEARLRKEMLKIVAVDGDDDEGSAGCNIDDGNDDPTTEWLDIKYCHLRNDIPMEQQLFDSLQVKITREVVSLIEPTPQNQGKNKGKRCRQRRKQKRKEKQMQEKLAEMSVAGDDESSKSTAKLAAAAKEVVNIEDWRNNTPAQHLSPEEWNNKLLELAQQEGEGSFQESEAVLLDTRNIYETRVGHFAVPNLPTMFPNTRKFSSLPLALNTEEAAEALAGKDVFLYCTGGVRCERAGTYLRALSDSNSGAWQGKEKPKAIFQLKGGIQKYLETYGEQVEPKSDDDDNAQCLYRGKNFVFDQRRTDPVIGKGITSKTAGASPERVESVGQCIICSKAHDDYDNGFSPCDEKEARCCRCRVLVLVCNDCRPKVRSCGEPEKDNATDLLCGRTACIDEGNVSENVETIRF